MTHILEKLARARAAQVDAATALEQVTQANSALLVRMAESRAKSEEAVRETKANGDPDGKWAMQLRLALDDQADIKSMLTGSQAVLNERSAAASAATSAAHSAESASAQRRPRFRPKSLTTLSAYSTRSCARPCSAAWHARTSCIPANLAQRRASSSTKRVRC